MKRGRMGLTHYSAIVTGTSQNWHQDVRFDKTDGYLGISARQDGHWKDRVLLTPTQIIALLKYLADDPAGWRRWSGLATPITSSTTRVLLVQ